MLTDNFHLKRMNSADNTYRFVTTVKRVYQKTKVLVGIRHCFVYLFIAKEKSKIERII